MFTWLKTSNAAGAGWIVSPDRAAIAAGLREAMTDSDENARGRGGGQPSGDALCVADCRRIVEGAL
jgi:hypothetical protein